MDPTKTGFIDMVPIPSLESSFLNCHNVKFSYCNYPTSELENARLARHDPIGTSWNGKKNTDQFVGDVKDQLVSQVLSISLMRV